MTDLEMIRDCAEAMAGDPEWESACEVLRVAELVRETQPAWAAHLQRVGRNAQAMALVKKFKLACGWDYDGLIWCETISKPFQVVRDATDLNRAIVECVSKMHRAKVAVV